MRTLGVEPMGPGCSSVQRLLSSGIAGWSFKDVVEYAAPPTAQMAESAAKIAPRGRQTASQASPSWRSAFVVAVAIGAELRVLERDRRRQLSGLRRGAASVAASARSRARGAGHPPAAAVPRLRRRGDGRAAAGL